MQIAFAFLLHRFVQVEEVDIFVAVAALSMMTCNAMVETFSYQVDNLFLPLLLAPAALNINWMKNKFSELQLF